MSQLLSKNMNSTCWSLGDQLELENVDLQSVQTILCRVPDLTYGVHPYGLCEAKCPEECKDYDLHNAASVAKDFCLYVSDDGTFHINKTRHYFDQVQMQLVLTGCKWCDFIVYTFKGLVIDSLL